MAPWQVLRAGKATQAALGYRVHHGPGGLVHYSTAPAAVAADSSRSFCLSREKGTLQQLNRRLALYLQQVQCLEAANQKLESQIQRELNRKCPKELRELDGHLRTVSLLHDQIGECLSAQAQVKLQLLSAELTVFDLNIRCEKERKHRGCLEAELSDLRLVEEELHVHRLPELHSLLNDQTQELMELQIEHQQDMQGLLAQMSGGSVTVEMQPAESSDLIQQLDDLRQTSVMLLDKNQNECWFNAQVSMLSSPEVTFDPPAGSEVIQAELEEVRRRTSSLEEELTRLTAANVVLEASGREQNESFVQQLVVLQQRADSLCNDLDSVLQAAAQQAADHQNLLDVKTRLETEIQDYRRLLDGLSPLGVSSLHSNSAAHITSLCVPTSPSAFRRNITVNKTVRGQGGNLRMMEVQDVSTGHICTVGQTSVIAPLSETVTTVQSIRGHSKHPNNSTVTSINTSNLTGSFHKSENQRTRAPPERTWKGSMTTTGTINRQSSPVGDKFHTEHRDLQSSSIVSTQISQGLDKAAVVKASKLETNTAQGARIVPDAQSIRSAAVQTKPEAFTSKQTTTEAGVQANKTETDMITKTIPSAEPEIKQGPNFLAHTVTTDSSKQTAIEVRKETETVIPVQMNCIEGSIEGKHQDPTQVLSWSLETPAEAETSVVSGSLMPEEAQGKVNGDLTLMDDKDTERQEKKGEEEEEAGGTLPVLRLDQNKELSDASNTEQNKVMEDADTGSSIVTASSSSAESNDSLESEATQGINTLAPYVQSIRSAAVQAKPDTFTSNQTTTEAGVQANKTETYIQTAITKTIPSAKPEVKQGPNLLAHTTTTDPSKETAAEVKKETTVISVQMSRTEGSIQGKHQDPTQVVSLTLETPAKAVRDVEEVAITASFVSGSHILRSEEAQGKVYGDLTPMDNKDIERQEKKVEKKVEGTLPVLRLDQSSSLSDASHSKRNEVMEDAGTGSDIITSSGSPDSNGNRESKTTSTESLKKVELVKNGKVVNIFQDTREVKGDPTELENEMLILADQEVLLSTTESKKSTRRTDSGVLVSSSSYEEPLSPREGHAFLSPTKPVTCLSPEICLSPVESEVLMSMTDQVFRPVDLEERVLSPSDSGTCLSPAEAKECLSPNGDEEEEEVCLSLTEANAHVRPVEKYILSTKEEGQSLSFSTDEALPEVDRNRKVSISVRDGESLCFGSFEGDNISRDTMNFTSNSKPTTHKISPQLNSSCMASNVAASLGGTVASSSGTVSGNAEAAVTAGVQGRFRQDSGELRVYGSSLGHRNMSLPNTESKDSSSGATSPATSQQETGRFSRRGSGEWMVYGGSLGRKSSLPRTKSEESPSAAMLLATSPPETRFGSVGSGVVYSSSPKHTSIMAGNDSLPDTESRESLPTAMHRAISPPGTGKFGSRGSGEWKVYGGSTGRMSSWAGSDNLPNADKKENLSVTAQLPISPPGSIGAGRFGSGGSGEWRVYGGSSGRMSSWAGSNDLANTDKEENSSVAAQLPISPPGSIGAGRFGSGGSGEWKVYGRSTGRMSSWAGSDNLPIADKEENPSEAAQLPISPPGSIGAGRFGSGGSGEWRVYGGGTGRLSSTSTTDRVTVGEPRNQMISPPSSYTSSGLRCSSAGSSGRLSSSSVVRRSSSVGSGGRLSSSGSGGRLSSSPGSHKTSSSGRFTSPGSSECKPVYSSASGRKSGVGTAARSGGGGTISSQRAPSPGGRMSASMGGGGWLSSSTTGGNSISSTGSGSKLSSAGGSDRVSSRAGGRISSSSGSGRTNSTGGRVISSSDRPIRSTGSGAGGNKERISVCKMAALSMSAAGRERSQDRQREVQRRQQQQQQQQQAAATSPLLQRWLTSGVEIKGANPDGLDDIMRL